MKSFKKESRLYEAIGQIDDSLIKESFKKTYTKKRYFKFIVSAVAVLALIIGSFSILPSLTKTNSGLQVKVSYPKAYD